MTCAFAKHVFVVLKAFRGLDGVALLFVGVVLALVVARVASCSLATGCKTHEKIEAQSLALSAGHFQSR